MILGGKYKFLLFLYVLPAIAKADVLPLDDALRATYMACVGIDESLSDLKTMAGINTAVTAVGTGLGAGATVVGIVKANKDAKARKKYDDYINQRPLQVYDADEYTAFFEEWKKSEWSDGMNEYNKLREESKTLGNWRTGLMAGNTVTNVAGAIIAGNNKVDEDLQTQIDNCKLSVKNLRESIILAKFNDEDVSEANRIVEACREYDFIDISPINDRAKGAMISSVVGATTGLAGTVTSAVANSENVRKDEETKQGKKTNADWDTEKNWNTAANILAGTSTVASGVATVFNATQISAIKKVAAVAEKCTGVLK